jgi:hypothetical protein
MGSVADSVATKVRITIDGTNFPGKKRMKANFFNLFIFDYGIGH